MPVRTKAYYTHLQRVYSTSAESPGEVAMCRESSYDRNSPRTGVGGDNRPLSPDAALRERLRDQPVRRPPALVVAGDRDHHDLVRGKLFLHLQQFLAHLARIAENQARALLLDVGALLPRVAVGLRLC